MSGGDDGVGRLKLSDANGSSPRGNSALGVQSIEDEIAQSAQLADYEKRIKQLQRNIARLKENLEQGGKPHSQAKPGSKGKARHIAHAEGWQAVCTAPDFCKVGKDVVAFNSFATLDQKRTASPNVKARGTPIYRKGDVLQNVQADAGKHVVSGTSLGSGHVKILDGHTNVKVNGVPVARHDSRCLINCDASGVGGAQGKLVTEQKIAGAAAPRAESDIPPGQRTSAKLQALKKAREAIVAGQTNFDALDEYVNFEQSHEALDGLIKQISGAPGTGGDYAAQVARGLLGFTKDFVLGAGELAYESIKLVPKLVRLTQTQTGALHAQLDAQILVENIKLENISPESVGQAAVDIGKAIVKPVTDPWSKGLYVESITRGAAEAGTMGLGWLKGGKGALARKAAAAADATPGTLLTRTIDAVAPPSGVGGGIHVKAVSKPEFSGDWGNYKTHGVKADPMESIEGRRMVAEFEKQGRSVREAIEEAAVLIRSGSTLPLPNPIEVGDKFYKLISKGGTVGENSAFWATKEELGRLKGMTHDQIADRLGLPLASQSGTIFEVMEITAFRNGATFSSLIAPTAEIGANGVLWSQRGGGIQTLLTDRSLFTKPILTGIQYP
jgi:uncharacterized Zn-binding protein involved in type VI secretion